jgi:Domain of unknown function (DUF4382)
MNVHRHHIAGLLVTGAVGFIAACGSSAKSTNPPPTGQGQFSVALVDAPNRDVSAIVVNVTQVTAHVTRAAPPAVDGWVVISPPTVTAAHPLTVDLLQLKTSAQDLGFANLPKDATVTQIRLVVAAGDNYVVLLDKTTRVDLKVPSGAQSGIKIHGPWQIGECKRTVVTLDFDGLQSLDVQTHPTGHGDEWILRPVIRVKTVVDDDVGCKPDDGGTDGGPGGTCDATHACLGETEVCLAGVCIGGPGAPCILNAQCESRFCDTGLQQCGQGGDSAPCTLDTQCLSAKCTQALPAGSCAKGGGGAQCRANSDCESDSCDGEVSLCNAPASTLVPPGGPCTASAECQYGACDAGKCTSGMGEPCAVLADCQVTLTCSASLCEPPRAL